MHLYKTKEGAVLDNGGVYSIVHLSWNEIINRDNLHAFLASQKWPGTTISDVDFENYVQNGLVAPIEDQEVWAAGVTYLRSRDARMEESQDAGGADCYQKVYEADRPELFFKSVASRVAAHNETVHIRRDSDWNVPEPELTLYINANGSIQAYSIGNDMSSRSIEGENPLYLPQAKVYERSAALGPCLYIPAKPISKETIIRLTIERGGQQMYTDTTPISRMKRSLDELAGYLFRELDFPTGCFLMTGTCLVPPNEFTLQAGDRVVITIDGIGTLVNTVAVK